jgi:hypothetical protein
MQLTAAGLQLRVENLRHQGKWYRAGTLTWSTQRGFRASVAFKVIQYRHEADLLLAYEVNRRPVQQKISFEPTEQRVGRRWWFLCPSCHRRIGVLYLPAGLTEFRCRYCYRLRYRSQQRDLDFLLKPIAAVAGVSRRIARKYLEESGRYLGLCLTGNSDLAELRGVRLQALPQ